MPLDIFGKGKGGPSNEDIEREAQRELDRLTRQAAPRPGFDPGALGGGPVGAPAGMGAPGYGPPSPLEQMAAEIGQRKTTRKKRRSQQQDRSGFPGQGFAGPAAITGSVGSSLGYGGGVSPGSRPKAPPPDAQPLGYRGHEDDDDDADDDIGVTEMALRDHADRFGRGLEDTVIRSDPAAAESMREQALRQFMERQQSRPGGGSAPPPGPGGGAPLRLRKRSSGAFRKLRQVEEPDVDEIEEDEIPEGELEDELADTGLVPEDDELEDLGDLDEPPAEFGDLREDLGEDIGEGIGDGIGEFPDEGGAPPTGAGGDERARLAEDRAIMAEDRAKLAEDRARLAEERASYAEARAWAAEQEAAEANQRMNELAEVVARLEMERDEARAQAAAPPPPPEKRPRKPPPAKAAPEAAKADAPAKKRTRKTPAPKKGAPEPVAEEPVTEDARPARAKAAKTAKAAKAPKAAKKARAAKKAAPAQPAAEAPGPEGAAAEPEPAEEEGPRLGGVLGRRLGKQPERPAPAPARKVVKAARKR